MFTFDFLVLVVAALSSLLVSAHPVALRAPTTGRTESTESLQLRSTQMTLNDSSNSTISTTGFHTLMDLYEGNKKFRQNVRLREEMVAETPSFMFIGCADSRLSPSTIFNTPTGSTISLTNVANQYKPDDISAKAAVAYAIESNIRHIIVLGHYGCKGVETAITKPSTVIRAMKSWLKSISYLYSKSRRTEIVKLRDSRMPQRGKPHGITTAPAANDAGFRALVEENIKYSVKELREQSMLAKAYSKTFLSGQNDSVDVFVHGLVYDEVTREVHNLNVSFGPPGKPVPSIPFKAVAAAKNFHRDNDRPGITKGKTWDFSAHPWHT